jgi:hypothetical protein
MVLRSASRGAWAEASLQPRRRNEGAGRERPVRSVALESRWYVDSAAAYRDAVRASGCVRAPIDRG